MVCWKEEKKEARSWPGDLPREHKEETQDLMVLEEMTQATGSWEPKAWLGSQGHT